MANAYSRARQYGEYLQPINVGMVAQVMQTKQQQYDNNYMLIQSTMDRVANLDLIRPQDAEYLQERLNQVNVLITQAGSLDLASNAVTTSLIKGINSAIDNNVMNAYTGTKLRRKELEEIDALRKKDPNSYNAMNYAAYNEKFDEWYNNPEAGAVYSGSTYVPYRDIDKEIQDIMVKAHTFLKKKETVSETIMENGVPYIQTHTRTIIDPERAKMLIQSKLSTLQPQIEINAKFGTNPEAVQAGYQSLMTKNMDSERAKLAMYKAEQARVGIDTELGKEYQISIDNIEKSIDRYTEEAKRGYTEASAANMYRAYIEDSFVSAYSGVLVDEHKFSPNTAMLAIMRLQYDREQAEKVTETTSPGVLPDMSVPDTSTTHKGEIVEDLIVEKIDDLERRFGKEISKELNNILESNLGEGEFERITGIDRNTDFSRLTADERDTLIEMIRTDASKFSDDFLRLVPEIEASKMSFLEYRQDVLNEAGVFVDDLLEATYEGLTGTGTNMNTIYKDFTITDPTTNKRVAIGDYLGGREASQESSGIKVLRNGRETELTKEEYAKASVAMQFAKYYGMKARGQSRVGMDEDFEVMMNYAAQIFSGVEPDGYLETKEVAKKAKSLYSPSIWESYADHEGFWNKLWQVATRPILPNPPRADVITREMALGIKEMADLYGGNGDEFLKLFSNEISTSRLDELDQANKRMFRSWFSSTDSNIHEVNPRQDYTGEAASRSFRSGFAKTVRQKASQEHLERVVTREYGRNTIFITTGEKAGQTPASALDPLRTDTELQELPKNGTISFSMEGTAENPSLTMSWFTPATATRAGKTNRIPGITPQQISALNLPPKTKQMILDAMNVNTVLGINPIGKSRPNIITTLVDDQVRPQLKEVLRNKLSYNELIAEYSPEIAILSGESTDIPLGVRLTERADGDNTMMMFEYVLGDTAFAAEIVADYLEEKTYLNKIRANNSLPDYLMSLSQEQLVAILNRIRSAR